MLCVHMYIYIYIYRWVYIHTYIYIYIYVYACKHTRGVPRLVAEARVPRGAAGRPAGVQNNRHSNSVHRLNLQIIVCIIIDLYIYIIYVFRHYSFIIRNIDIILLCIMRCIIMMIQLLITHAN